MTLNLETAVSILPEGAYALNSADSCGDPAAVHACPDVARDRHERIAADAGTRCGRHRRRLQAGTGGQTAARAPGGARRHIGAGWVPSTIEADPTAENSERIRTRASGAASCGR